MPKSTYLDNQMLNAVLRNVPYTSTAVYVALYNGNPLSGGSEVAGGGYARQAATFAAPVNGSAATSAPIAFTNMPATTVSYVAIIDALSGGNMLYSAPAAASKNTNAGDTVSIAAGNLTVSET